MMHVVKYFHIVGERDDGTLIVEIPPYTYTMMILYVLPKGTAEKYLRVIKDDYDGLSYLFEIRRFHEETGIDFIEKFKRIIPKSMPRPYVPEEFYRYDTIILRINRALEEVRYSDSEIRREARNVFGITDLPEG